ncbi:MAG: 30S ribosomal protein S17 [Leptospiraceae bacterium]|nr:30S ribosomal protein S17 [Spirochaetaceae bacterium]|tara:strand:+ start:74085 stop:74348 length:264 start_codon:yes stop_codon:yes gene_type:complete
MKTRAKRIRTIVGRVVSDKTDKTRVILVETFFTHPKFKKTVKRSQRIKIHDEKNESREGDIVSAIETRPLSRWKRHRLFKVVERPQA